MTKVVSVAPHFQHALGGSHCWFRARAVVEVLALNVRKPPKARDGAFEDHVAPPRFRRRAQVDDVVGDRDHLRLVFDDEYLLAFFASCTSRSFIRLDVGEDADRWSARRTRR